MLLHGAMKRAVMARIADLADAAGPADALYGVQVSPHLPPEPDRKCVYGGRLRFTQRPLMGERNVANEQTIVFDIRVRVVELGDDVDETESTAESIEQAIAVGLVAPPSLTGSGGWLDVVAGDSDPTVVSPNPEPAVTVNRVLTVQAVVARAGV